MASGPFAYADQGAVIAGSRDAWKDSVEDFPGPGAYNLVKPVPSAKEFIAQRRDVTAKGLVHAKRCTQASLYDEQKVDYPGPGSYSPIENNRASRKAIPGRSTFGHKEECIKKACELAKEIPGPGSYFDTPLPSKKRGFTFGHRPSLFGRSDPDEPGPASYRANEPGRRGGQSSWAASAVKRFPRNNPEHATPGPGDYGSQSHHQGGRRGVERTGVPGLRPRRTMDDLDTPGPGSYDPKLQSKGAPVTIKLRTGTTTESLSPGPGAYDSPRVGRRAPAYSIGKRLGSTFAPLTEPTEFNMSPGRQRHGMSTSIGRHEFGRPHTARV